MTQMCDRNMGKQIYGQVLTLRRGEIVDSSPSDEDLVLIMPSKKEKKRFWVHPFLQSSLGVCVLSPILDANLTHDCQPLRATNTVTMFADGTTVFRQQSHSKQQEDQGDGS